ncbi:MAG: PEP-CTERM sorting domain-containing protein [Myxococcota bacterium]|nr:PEP-CTERM sorting domain-containing protein [Myxococcota bacterium]
MGASAFVVFWSLVGASFDAQAGVSYELIFRSTGTNQVEFASVEEARSATVVSDLLLTSTDALRFHSISVGWDDSKGLDLVRAAQWVGVNLQRRPLVYHLPVNPAPCKDFSGSPRPPDPGFPYCSSFSGAKTTRAVPPPALSPGTYNIGTIVWDTTAVGPGQSPVFPFVLSVNDETVVVRPPDGGPRDTIYITGTETLLPSFITVIPEPATAGLLGLGLWGLLLVRRRASEAKEA